MTEPPEDPAFNRGYTLVLIAVSFLFPALLILADLTDLRLFDGTPAAPTNPGYLLIAAVSFALLFTAFARAHSRAEAYGASAVFGAIMAIFFYPIGTVVYIYWLVRLRRQERFHPGRESAA